MTNAHLLPFLLELVELTSSAASFSQVQHLLGERLQDALGVERLSFETLSPTEQTSLESTSVQTFPLIHAEEEHTRLEKQGTALCLPLVGRTSVVGILTCYSYDPLVHTPEGKRMMQACCTLIANMIESEQLGIEREDLNQQLEVTCSTDALTGLYNPRHFTKVLRREVGRAQRYRRPLSCLMFAVDAFNTITETYGRESGDKVLTEFAGLLAAVSRDSDIPSRQGTARFALLAIETPADAATVLGDRLLSIWQEKKFSHAGIPFRVTAHVGIVSMPAPHIQSPEQFLEAAQAALHAAPCTSGVG